MDALAELTALEAADSFVARHVAPSGTEIAGMLAVVGAASLEDLAGRTVPPSIQLGAIQSAAPMELPAAIDEAGAIAELRGLAAMNDVKTSLIGQGYHGTHTPPVILRNVLENPGWYTAYTPYQAEIAQGRLEALLNYQTMVCDLTGMPIANASLLDEATAAAEAMTMAERCAQIAGRSRAFFVDGQRPAIRRRIAVIRDPGGCLWRSTVIDAARRKALQRSRRPTRSPAIFQYPGTTWAMCATFSAEIAALHAARAIAVVCDRPAGAGAC